MAGFSPVISRYILSTAFASLRRVSFSTAAMKATTEALVLVVLDAALAISFPLMLFEETPDVSVEPVARERGVIGTGHEEELLGFAGQRIEALAMRDGN